MGRFSFSNLILGVIIISFFNVGLLFTQSNITDAVKSKGDYQLFDYRDVDEEVSISKVTGKKLNGIIIAGLSLAILLLLMKTLLKCTGLMPNKCKRSLLEKKPN